MAIAKSPDLSLYRIVLIISLVAWTTSARLVRGVTLTLKTRDFVQAAVAQGASTARILFVHILPNALSPILVAATLASGNIILLESTLSFLGLGIQPPVASWGNILTNAQEIIWSQPMQAIYPGILIFATVISLNFVGDGLQDAFDPRTEGGSRYLRRATLRPGLHIEFVSGYERNHGIRADVSGPEVAYIGERIDRPVPSDVVAQALGGGPAADGGFAMIEQGGHRISPSLPSRRNLAGDGYIAVVKPVRLGDPPPPHEFFVLFRESCELGSQVCQRLAL